MDYKSKYIKYKLKYLKLGGMGTLKRHEPTTKDLFQIIIP